MVVLNRDDPNPLAFLIPLDLDDQAKLSIQPQRVLSGSIAFQFLEVQRYKSADVPFVFGILDDSHNIEKTFQRAFRVSPGAYFLCIEQEEIIRFKFETHIPLYIIAENHGLSIVFFTLRVNIIMNYSDNLLLLSNKYIIVSKKGIADG